MSLSLQMIYLLKKLVTNRIHALKDVPEEREKNLLRSCEQELSEIEVFYQKKPPLLYSRRFPR